MKKLISALVIVATLFTFAACGDEKVYEAEAAEFSSNGMTITLTEAFKESTYEGYTVCYDSDEVAIFVIKEAFTLQAGLNDMSLKDYAELVKQSNASKSATDILTEDGLTTMEYSFLNEEENQTYKYLSVMFKGDDAFWVVQFSCYEDAYEEYKPYFIEWAKSVDVTSAS